MGIRGMAVKVLLLAFAALIAYSTWVMVEIAFLEPKPNEALFNMAAVH